MTDITWIETLDGDDILKLLVGDPEEFLSLSWNRKPHHRSTGDSGLFRAILDERAMDEVMSDRHLREPYIRVAKEGRPLSPQRYTNQHVVQKTPVGGVLDIDKTAMEFNAGATILLDSIDHHYPPLEVLCRKLGQRLSAHAEAVAFATPASIQGLSVHYDDTEVFVMQISGTKKWTVYEQVRPLVGYGKAVNPAELGAPTLEVELQPGDCLYVPWGAPHYAVSGDQVSCHVSVQFRPQTWGQFLEDLIEEAVNSDHYERVVPGLIPNEEEIASSAAQHLEAGIKTLEAVDVPSFMESQIRKQRGPKNAIRGGFLQQMARRTELDVNDTVTLNTADAFAITDDDGTAIRIATAERTFQYPCQARTIIESLSEQGSLRISDIECGLDERNLLKVVGHLAENGVLLIAASPVPAHPLTTERSL